MDQFELHCVDLTFATFATFCISLVTIATYHELNTVTKSVKTKAVKVKALLTS